MILTKEQRAMMAAHICDLAARMLRSGTGGGSMLDSAADCLRGSDPCTSYRGALIVAGLSAADINAACDAISRGAHPPDSLPGKIIRARALAQRERDDEPKAKQRNSCDGEIRALGEVLTLLGCKVTP